MQLGLGCPFTIADVLEEGFIEKVKNDIPDIKGVAYCVGSIDLKPVRMVTEQDFIKCMKLNLYSAVEVIKGYQESLKKIIFFNSFCIFICSKFFTRGTSNAK